MTDHQSSPAPWQLPLEQRQRECRRCLWAGLAVMGLFAAVFLQYGFIDRWAMPAAQRTNDGASATFFAVHLSPYYEFS